MLSSILPASSRLQAWLRLGLLLASGFQASTQGRLHELQLPSRGYQSWDDAATSFDGSGLFIFKSPRLYRFSFVDGSTALLVDQSRPPVSSEGKPCPIPKISAMCALGKGSLLGISGNGEILRLRTRTDGRMAEEPIRPPLAGYQGLAPTAALRRADGTVLVVDPWFKDLVRLRLEKDQVQFDTFCPVHVYAPERVQEGPRVVPSDEAPRPDREWERTFIAELPDHSVLVTASDLGPIKRVHLDGRVTLFSGAARGSSGPSEYPGWNDPTYSMICLDDGSVVILDLADYWEPRLVRLRDGKVTLLAGVNKKVGEPLELDPQFFDGQIDLNSCLRLEALPGNNILLNNVTGFTLLAPMDDLQHRLDALVEKGKEGVRRGDWKAYREAAEDLKLLGTPTADIFRLLNKRGQLIGDMGRKGTTSMSAIDRRVGEYADRAVDLFRARRAAKELETFTLAAAGGPREARAAAPASQQAALPAVAQEPAHPASGAAASARDSALHAIHAAQAARAAEREAKKVQAAVTTAEIEVEKAMAELEKAKAGVAKAKALAAAARDRAGAMARIANKAETDADAAAAAFAAGRR